MAVHIPVSCLSDFGLLYSLPSSVDGVFECMRKSMVSGFPGFRIVNPHSATQDSMAGGVRSITRAHPTTISPYNQTALQVDVIW